MKKTLMLMLLGSLALSSTSFAFQWCELRCQEWVHCAANCEDEGYVITCGEWGVCRGLAATAVVEEPVSVCVAEEAEAVATEPAATEPVVEEAEAEVEVAVAD